MRQQRKHILEFFRNDSWCVRVGVLLLQWSFSLALAGLLMGLGVNPLDRTVLRLVLKGIG